MSGFSYTVSGFGSFPSRGLAWADNSSRPYIATFQGSTYRFAVPFTSSTTSLYWEYSNNGGASWTYWTAGTVVTPTTPLIFDGTTYNYYVKSPNWGAGNTSYIQRFGGGTLFSGVTSLGEVIAKDNNAENYTF